MTIDNYISLKIILLIIILQLAGCTSKKNGNEEYYIKIKDDLNREIILNHKPVRIVSLAPSITEILFALDEGKTLVGVTEYCDYPEAVKSKASVGGMINPNIEKIAELNPDLIFITVEGNNENDFNKLQKMGYTIYVLNPTNIENIYNSILNIGKLIGAEDSAIETISLMRKKQYETLKNIKFVIKKKVLVIISIQPLICAGNGTFINEMLAMIGVKNIAAELNNPYPILNREFITKENPDAIVIMNDAAENKEEILNLYPEWKNLKSFKGNSVNFIEADIVSRPGTRIIDGLEQIVNILK